MGILPTSPNPNSPYPEAFKMGWRDHVNSLKKEFDTISKEVESGISKFTGSGSAQQHPPQPPPNYPPRQPPAPYWRAQFDQNVAVTQEWDAKMGNGPDGLLVLRALAQNQSPDPEQKYTSARLVSRATLARDRGCLTAMIQSPCAPGIWPAFWLLPQEPFSWTTDGEIDIAETWN